jgi:hypothetical protein
VLFTSLKHRYIWLDGDGLHPDVETVQRWSADYFRWKWIPDADGVREEGYLVDSCPCVGYQKAVVIASW